MTTADRRGFLAGYQEATHLARFAGYVGMARAAAYRIYLLAVSALARRTWLAFNQAGYAPILPQADFEQGFVTGFEQFFTTSEGFTYGATNDQT
jgi:hypothetical protein